MSFDRTDVEQIAFDTTGDEVFGLPSGTTAQRPASPSNGFMRHNTDENVIEAYINGEWVKLDSSAYVVYSFQGSVSGYASGGFTSTETNIIDKFSLTSDANATDVGDLTSNRFDFAGHSSDTHGYTSGGYSSYPTEINVIDKFSFSSDGNSTDVADMTIANSIHTGNSSSTHGYNSGGNFGGGNTNDVYDVIDKFPFATDSNASDVGDLLFARHGMAGQNSSTHGYVSGANRVDSTRIEKFSFSSDGNSTDVGNLTVGRKTSGGQSSVTHGYTSGGDGTNTIDKFTFSSDANATDVGDLIDSVNNSTGQSSTTHGYKSGGNLVNTIQKFSFSADGNASDVGDLTVARRGLAGQQV